MTEPATTESGAPLADVQAALRSPEWIGTIAIITIAFVWSYLPTIGELMHAWKTIADYSHGFLVLPLALYALWVRLDTFPVGQVRWFWWGLGIIGISVAMRVFGGLYYIGGIDGWSIIVWVAGACLLCGGWRFFLWVWPGVAFLFFMIPWPYRVEGWLRQPLQKIATSLSTWLLQCLGQPALGGRNTIWLGEHELEVEDACSGLRIFVAIAVLAFAYILIARPRWWERVILVVSIIPIALLTNSARIVVTGLLYQFVSGKAGKQFSHDLAGWMMIPFAAALFLLELWYLGKLIRQVEAADMQQMLRGEAR